MTDEEADPDFFTVMASRREAYITALRKAYNAGLRELKPCGWITQDGFPLLEGHKPIKPGATLFARKEDFV